jgi:hypothetical protein
MFSIRRYVQKYQVINLNLNIIKIVFENIKSLSHSAKQKSAMQNAVDGNIDFSLNLIHTNIKKNNDKQLLNF